MNYEHREMCGKGGLLSYLRDKIGLQAIRKDGYFSFLV